MENKKFYICDKNNCTLCMICENFCSQNAIQLDIGEYGFKYLRIDELKYIFKWSAG